MKFNERSFIFIICFTLVLFSMYILPTSQYLIAETDRLALLAFKENINDPLGALTSWNESSHCSNWTGITCGRRHPNRVVGLDLQSLSLKGLISPHMGNLSFLRNFNLRDNHFTGGIPQEIGYLSRLQVLRLSNNALVGGIPVELGSLSTVAELENQPWGGLKTPWFGLGWLKSII